MQTFALSAILSLLSLATAQAIVPLLTTDVGGGSTVITIPINQNVPIGGSVGAITLQAALVSCQVFCHNENAFQQIVDIAQCGDLENLDDLVTSDGFDAFDSIACESKA